MAISLQDLRQMFRGFPEGGYIYREQPASAGNPVRVVVRSAEGEVRYRVWCFDITHGGGGPTVRAADEFRIQISNGPQDAIDANGQTDLLLGYARDDDVIVGYDRRYLKHYLTKAKKGERPSPSAQVKRGDIVAGAEKGFHRSTKDTQIAGPQTAFLAFRPGHLPVFVRFYDQLLKGTMKPEEAAAMLPAGGHDLQTFCEERGFFFPPTLIARYVAALAAKPFVILSGISGTGKTKLAQIVAEYYTRSAAGAAAGGSSSPTTGTGFLFEAGPSAGTDRSRVAFVPVRPDWTDNQAILGFLNPITQHYESTGTLELILRARRAADEARAAKRVAPPYFLILDELNLARVEHYFSDFLSLIESRKKGAAGTIDQESIVLHRAEKVEVEAPRPDGTTEKLAVPARLELPTNLYVTGTVNVDETTHGFSPKVLDRAFVLEFEDVDLEGFRTNVFSKTAGAVDLPKDLPPYELVTRAHFIALTTTAHEHLKAVNGILEEARLHVGYRTASEIALFVERYKPMLSGRTLEAAEREALDAAILQKILPRIHGSRPRLELSLVRLALYLRDRTVAANADADTTIDADAGSAIFPASFARTIEMLETLRSYGFVSFFK
jgi:hypothetical protein